MHNASGGTLHGICRHVIRRLQFCVTVILLAGCTQPSPADYAALKSGSSTAKDCQERLHEGAPDFSECLRYVAANPPSGESRRDWWALGALYYGWLIQDQVAQHGQEGADEEARALVREVESLRLKLRAPEAALCALLPVDCALQRKRRSERLAGR